MVCVLDNYFIYKNDKLIISGYMEVPYYDLVMMLFQIIARVRKRVNVVIIDNFLIKERFLTFIKKLVRYLIMSLSACSPKEVSIN